MAANQEQLLSNTSRYNESATALAVCAGCFASSLSVNSTLNVTMCEALLGGASAVADAETFGRWLAQGEPEIADLSELVQSTTQWHTPAAMLPVFALGCISSCVIAGTLHGRRNLLVLAQFVAIIIWWMMCAILSVEFAISVGFADICLTPVATTLDVLRTVAQGDRQFVKPNDLWTYNLTGHYLSNCSIPNPLETQLLRIDRLANASLLLGAEELLPSACDSQRAALQSSVQSLLAASATQLDPLGAGPGSCGDNGTLASLFASAIEQAVCEDAASGFVGIFRYQLQGGLLLLLLSLLLPALWHSHALPPMTCRLPRLRMPSVRLRLSSVSISMRSLPRLTSSTQPDETDEGWLAPGGSESSSSTLLVQQSEGAAPAVEAASELSAAAPLEPLQVQPQPRAV